MCFVAEACHACLALCQYELFVVDIMVDEGVDR